MVVLTGIPTVHVLPNSQQGSTVPPYPYDLFCSSEPVERPDTLLACSDKKVPLASTVQYCTVL